MHPIPPLLQRHLDDSLADAGSWLQGVVQETQQALLVADMAMDYATRASAAEALSALQRHQPVLVRATVDELKRQLSAQPEPARQPGGLMMGELQLVDEAQAEQDIAVLRVNATGLPTVKFGDPKSLQVGDYVLAIGAPFGFDQSATAGIVSAKGRSLPGDAYVPFIQTDAAVNPGNSGGPLFDAAGNVVGINAQIYTQTGGYQGLSFAIPIDVALHAKDQIVATGHASHARLGVMVQDLNQALAESFGLARPDGALVSSVDPDGPAAAAGLKPGDVITQVDGSTVERAGDLSSRIGSEAPGKRVTLKLWRDRSARDAEVKLAEAESGSMQAGHSGSDEHGQLGLALRPLTRQERVERSLDHGLVVEEAGGPAARAGIQPGDVVLGIDGQPAHSVDQLRSVMRSRPRSVALLIERDGQKIFVPVKLG